MSALGGWLSLQAAMGLLSIPGPVLEHLPAELPAGSWLLLATERGESVFLRLPPDFGNVDHSSPQVVTVGLNNHGGISELRLAPCPPGFQGPWQDVVGLTWDASPYWRCRLVSCETLRRGSEGSLVLYDYRGHGWVDPPQGLDL